jgi:hypothetical protein
MCEVDCDALQPLFLLHLSYGGEVSYRSIEDTNIQMLRVLSEESSGTGDTLNTREITVKVSDTWILWRRPA